MGLGNTIDMRSRTTRTSRPAFNTMARRADRRGLRQSDLFCDERGEAIVLVGDDFYPAEDTAIPDDDETEGYDELATMVASEQAEAEMDRAGTFAASAYGDSWDDEHWDSGFIVTFYKWYL